MGVTGMGAVPAGLLPWGKVFLAAAITIALASSPPTPPALTAVPQVTVDICRAGVEPCQREVNLPVGGTVGLDLFLEGPGTGDTSEPRWLVAWETHFQLVDSSAVFLAEAPGGGEPVREQGNARYALEGLTRLGGNAGDEADGAAVQYFPVQNRYDADSGKLDYAVTLLRFNPVEPVPRVLPFPDQSRILLGRIEFRGATQGRVSIVGNGSSGIPFQAILLNQSDQLDHLTPSAASTPLATLDIGPAGGTVQLEGQLARHRPTALAITFWVPGSLPPWKKGTAAPIATFYDVLADANGMFRVPDLSPSVLPAGTYDLRVKGRHTLADLVPNIKIPAPASNSPEPTVVNIAPRQLRDGDIDSDHIVDRLDLLALKDTFGRLAGSPGYDDRADFNQDSLVDSQDFSRLAQSYNSQSD